jgi:hypothetical protein
LDFNKPFELTVTPNRRLLGKQFPTQEGPSAQGGEEEGAAAQQPTRDRPEVRRLEQLDAKDQPEVRVVPRLKATSRKQNPCTQKLTLTGLISRWYQSSVDFKCPYANRPLMPLTPLTKSTNGSFCLAYPQPFWLVHRVGDLPATSQVRRLEQTRVRDPRVLEELATKTELAAQLLLHSPRADNNTAVRCFSWGTRHALP